MAKLYGICPGEILLFLRIAYFLIIIKFEFTLDLVVFVTFETRKEHFIRLKYEAISRYTILGSFVISL